MQLLLVAFAAAAGLLAATQAGTNAALGRAIGPIPAGVASVLGTAVCLSLLGLALGGLSWPTAERASGAPWWAWPGGIMGAVVIAAQLFTAQQLGSAVFGGVFVTATIAASVVLDHFGLFGFKEHPASWLRLGGVVLMVAGLAIVART